MDQRGETALLDRQIETLMNRDKLTEEEVKVLCEKVSTNSSNFFLPKIRPLAFHFQ